MKRLWLFALLLFPVASLASGGFFGVSSDDKSMQYLGMVLGTIPGTPILGGESPLIAAVFAVFNQVIFVLGILIICYTTIIGTLTTAQEGEFLGKKKWHPVIVPVRAALGTYLLLPSNAGYNWIQIAVIWFIVQGVGAANTLWKQVIYHNSSQGGIHTDNRQVNLLQASTTVNSILRANACMEAINNDNTALSLLGERVTAYRWENKIVWGRHSHANKEPALCGAINLPSVDSSPFSNMSDDQATARNDILANAVLQAQATLVPAAMEALYGAGSNTLGPASFATAANGLSDAVRKLDMSFSNLEDINQQAITNGWIHAGSYYFQIVRGNGNPLNMAVTFTSEGSNTTLAKTLLGTALGTQLLSTSSTAASDYIRETTGALSTTSSPTGGLQLSHGQSDATPAGSLLSIILGQLMNLIVHAIIDNMSEGEGDPIVSMATFGSVLVTIVEIIFWLVISVLVAAYLLITIMHCISPLGPAANMMLGIIVSGTVLILGLFYVIGITLALYVPLIPYFVFTFASISWFILVLEALLGSSLIALSLIVPSEDEIGKAGHAIVILLGLFLRPALMILGFILGVQLLFVAIKMLNFGFWQTIVTSTGAAGGVGVFGMVVILSIYVSIATAFTHEAFSLIYLLPNKVLRWISGGAEGDEQAGEHAQKMRGAAEKGAGTGQKAMGGAAGGMKKKIDAGQKK